MVPKENGWVQLIRNGFLLMRARFSGFPAMARDGETLGSTFVIT